MSHAKRSASASPRIRKPEFESLLCEAIKQGVSVALRYHKFGEMADSAARIFGPVAVYHTEQRKVCVTGEQISNPNDISGNGLPHTFEVGRIIDLDLTTNGFEPSVTVDYSQPKYRSGIICRR